MVDSFVLSNKSSKIPDNGINE